MGIGNAAGSAVVAVREKDGMNQLGNEPFRGEGQDRVYKQQPYADYTGFEPTNSAYKLSDPSKWQPAITTSGYGIFKVQQFVTPQYALTRPYSYNNPQRFHSPKPLASDIKNHQAYKAQVDEVLAASAAMTDEQKMLAELFDNKMNSLGFSALFKATVEGLTLEEFVWYESTCGMTRFWGGVHFKPSIPAGQAIGREVGQLAYDFLMDHIHGTAPAP